MGGVGCCPEQLWLILYWPWQPSFDNGDFCYGILSFHGRLGVALDATAGVTAAGSFRFLERSIVVLFEGGRCIWGEHYLVWIYDK